MSEDDEESSQSSDQSSAEEDEGNKIKNHRVKKTALETNIKAMDRRRDQLERLKNEYQYYGESEEIAVIRATNALLSVYRSLEKFC